MSSSECEESYAKCLEKQNDRMNENEPVVASNNKPSHGSQVELEYMTPKS